MEQHDPRIRLLGPRVPDPPFTAWGQWPVGTLDRRVFDQDEYWVDIQQHPHRIATMSLEYRSNVVGFLLVHRDYYHRA